MLACLAAGGESAAGLYKKARKAQEKGDSANAYLLSSQAVARDPQEEKYWAFSQAVRSQGVARLKVDLGPGAAPEPAPPDLPPITEEDWRELRQAQPPPVLAGAAGVRSFNLRGDAKKLFEDVAAAFGLLVVFDADFQAGRPVQFRVENMDWKQSLRALEALTGSFIVAVNQKVALVAKDTTQKRAEIEPVMSVAIPFPEPLSPQDLQEAARAVQSTFDMTKMGLDNTRRVILFRDRVSRLKPALELMRQLMVHRAQVVTEVELLSVSEESTLNYGVKFQSAYPLTWLGTQRPFGSAETPAAVPASFHGVSLGGGKSMMGLGLTETGLFASASKGQATSVVRAELRGLDGQPAQLHVGDRYPILTAGYYGDTSGPGTVYRPPPTVNFEDLGVVLKVTPRTHGSDEVTLELEAEFKTLTGRAENGIPVISNRKFSTKVRMSTRETAIISGLVIETISQSWNGIPGLNSIPALRMNDKSGNRGQLLLTLRPRVVSLPPFEQLTPALWAGSETRALTPLD